MTWFTGYLPTARCQAIFAKVDAMARLLKADPESAAAVARAAASPGSTATAETCTAAGLDSPTGEPDSDPGESRTMDQLRADVFTDMLLNGPRGQGLETVQAEVFVTIPATMLPGTPGGPSTLDETPTDGFDSGGPSEAGGRARPGSSGTSGIDLPGALGRVTLTPGGPVPSILGGGPIDQDSAAQLMVAAKTWWRVITDPVTGAIVEFGQGRYRPTAAQKAILRFRDGSCTTPGCTGPGRSCEIDHTREWQDGGATDISNLRLGCKRCHRLKSLGLIEVEQRAGGTILVTSLFGTRRVGYPAAPWAVADPQQATAATGTDTGGDAPDDSIPGTAPPADQDSLIPKVEPASYHPVRPGEETAEKPCDAVEKAEPVDDQEQSLPDRDWGQVQDVPDSSSASPVHGRYAKTTQAKAARKRRLKRNAGEYGPSTIPRPDDRDNPLRPRQEPPQPPPEPPF